MFRADREAGESLALRTLHEAIHRAGVPIEVVHRGHAIPVGEGCQIRLLHPPAEGVPPKHKRDDRDNANSIVLAVDYAGRRMLLPGDLEKTGIDRLLAQSPLDCDVLLAPHHGSAHSNPTGFAGWSTPEWVVISGGHDAAPSVLAAYEARGAQRLAHGPRRRRSRSAKARCRGGVALAGRGVSRRKRAVKEGARNDYSFAPFLVLGSSFVPLTTLPHIYPP